MLVALRAWTSGWNGQHVTLRVKSDSVSALVLVLNLKTKGKGAGVVAREIALDIATSVYSPHVAEHIPGVENAVADVLSRQFEPGSDYCLPAALAGVQEMHLSSRDASYYRTLQPPCVKTQKSGRGCGAAASSSTNAH